MEELTVNFSLEQNKPLNATFSVEQNELKASFTAYNEPPSIIVEGTENYNELENKPLINDVILEGNKTLDELGIQEKGDYALKIDIPSLDGYVKDTDYATKTKAGVMKVDMLYGYAVNSSTGVLVPIGAEKSDVDLGNNPYRMISAARSDYAVKKGIINSKYTLTDEEIAKAKAWLGYADSTDIMQAIASIPQFKLSIVDELPLAGEKMTLYLVPKEGTNNDVYDEYIWIEQTESFEHLGTTAVDLTDYVKKTDVATAKDYGVVKVSGLYGVGINTAVGLFVPPSTTSQIDGRGTSTANKPLTIDKLDYAVKVGVTTNTIELTDEEKANAQAWLGIDGSGGSSVASIQHFKCLQFQGDGNINLTNEHVEKINNCETISIRIVQRGTAPGTQENRYWGVRSDGSGGMNLYWKYTSKLYYNSYGYNDDSAPLNVRDGKVLCSDVYTVVINRVKGEVRFYERTNLVTTLQADELKTDYFIDPSKNKLIIKGGDCKVRLYDLRIFDEDISYMFKHPVVIEDDYNACGASLVTSIFRGANQDINEWTDKNAHTYGTGTGWTKTYGANGKEGYSWKQFVYTGTTYPSTGFTGGYYVGGTDGFHAYRYRSYFDITGGTVNFYANNGAYNCITGMYDINTGESVDPTNVSDGSYFLEGYASAFGAWEVKALSGNPDIYHYKDSIKRICCLLHLKCDTLHGGKLFDEEMNSYYDKPEKALQSDSDLRQPLKSSNTVYNAHYDGEIMIKDGKVYTAVNYEWKQISN